MGNVARVTAKHVALARFLRAHDGAIDIGTLARLGFDRHAVHRMVSREQLVREHRGVYRVGAVATAHQTLLRCGLLAVGEDAAVSRASAAHLQGFIDFAPPQITIVVPRRNVRRNADGLVVHHTAELHGVDVRRVNGLRCTRPRLTILDLCAVTRTGPEYKLTRRALRQATVRHKRLPDMLSAVIEERGGFPGSRVLANLLDEHVAGTALTRSDLEDAFLELCRSADLPLPETNVIVEGFEVDGLWRQARIVVELDTYGFHGDVRSFENDRARDFALTVAGYRPVRITARRLEREPERIVAQIRALLAR